MAWLSHARWTTILKSMKDCQQAVCLAPSWLTHTCQCSRHELTDGKQPSHVNAKQKSGVYGCFSLHPSPTPRLCVNSSSPVGVAKHRLILCWEFCWMFEYIPYFPVWIYVYYLLLKLRWGEGNHWTVWIYVVLPFTWTSAARSSGATGLNVCRITFYSNWNMRESRFEYMSYYLLFKLNCRMGVSSIVWIYVVLPFAQTYRRVELCPTCLNICRIAFYSNSLPTIRMPEAFECMSYCLLLKLSMG